jgi:hypothetical protein
MERRREHLYTMGIGLHLFDVAARS